MIIRDENYFTDKYELTRTHSEVLEAVKVVKPGKTLDLGLSLIHISEPTRLGMISYAVFCLKKKKLSLRILYVSVI